MLRYYPPLGHKDHVCLLKDPDQDVRDRLHDTIFIPYMNHPGAFGTKRKFDHHTGVDLYTASGSAVYNMRAGVIRGIGTFTGEAVGSPWWNETQYIVVESLGEFFLYGEIEPVPTLEVGQNVARGQLIGIVQQVLKQDKGRPMSMLHIERFSEFVLVDRISGVVWEHDKRKPYGLKNPLMAIWESYELQDES